MQPLTQDKRVNLLPPSVANDLAAAWAIMDAQARRTAEIRDLVAKAWCDVEDLNRVRELRGVRETLAAALAAVDKAIEWSQMSAFEKQKEWRRRKQIARQEIQCP